MPDPRAFVSFDFDHNEESRNLFCGEARKDSPTPLVVQDWSSRTDLAQQEWKQIISAKINRTNMLIVLVGRGDGVCDGRRGRDQDGEGLLRSRLRLYVDGAGSSSPLPAGLPRSRTIAWTWAGVAAAIDQCMDEGKEA